MKKLLSFFTVVIAAITFASVSTACSDDAPLIDQKETTVESRDMAGLMFFRNNKLTVTSVISKTDLQLVLNSPTTRETDLAMWIVLRLHLTNGTTQDFNFVPTIYAGQRSSAPIQVPGVTRNQLASMDIIDATVIIQ